MRSERALVVSAADVGPLAPLVARLAPGDAAALAEGRVFVGRVRVTDGARPVVAGEEVRVAPPRERLAEDAVVLWHRDGIVAMSKPAAMPTIADHGGAAGTLLAAAEALTGLSKLHPTSRLDVGVSGVVLFADGEASRRLLAGAREAGRYTRRYVAIAARAPGDAGVWSAPIGRARDPRLREAHGRDATTAETAWAKVAVAPSGEALLAIEPRTGRTHQIRVHAAHAGAPLLGDAAYGGTSRLTSAAGAVWRVPRIALHCARVAVAANGGELVAEAEIPADFSTIWARLGGDAAAFAAALARW